MNMQQWVVDTWVLEKCNDFSSGICVDCTAFLSAILENGRLCVDIEGEILEEYDRYIQPHTFLSHWRHRMVREKGQISFFSNKLSNKCEQHLLKNLHFHSDDIMFVAVASKTKDKLLVSGDSDYNENVCEYLNNQLSVTVVSPRKAKIL
jgi:predicted nucleic acid-binding protein